jgi:hypothetical protein
MRSSRLCSFFLRISSCISRSSLQYGQFGSEQKGELMGTPRFSRFGCFDILTPPRTRIRSCEDCTLDVKHNDGMHYCEIIEVAHVADALGYPCGRDAAGECSDCGTRVCGEHVEKCNHCGELFCITCMGFHQSVAAKKPAYETSDQPRKRTA